MSGGTRTARSVVTTVVQQGPFDATSALTALSTYPLGSVLYETDASGNIVNEWVKANA